MKAILKIVEEFLFVDVWLFLNDFQIDYEDNFSFIMKFMRENIFRHQIQCSDWLEKYNENVFFQLFRMKRDTFQGLLRIIIDRDNMGLIKKKYRGGNFPVRPETSLLIFLWFMARQETLHSLADRFGFVPSTVMKIVNVLLYLIVRMKKELIYWPRNIEEFHYLQAGFQNYPGDYVI